MKWTRASEKPKKDGTYLCKFYADEYHAQLGCQYLEFTDGAFQVEHDEYYSLKWLDESDESPESSVWPGEFAISSKELDDLYIESASDCSRKHFDNIVGETITFIQQQWLQSRTAVKAENNKQWPLVTDDDFIKIYRSLEVAVERLKHHEFHNRELIEVLEGVLNENKQFKI